MILERLDRQEASSVQRQRRLARKRLDDVMCPDSRLEHSGDVRRFPLTVRGEAGSSRRASKVIPQRLHRKRLGPDTGMDIEEQHDLPAAAAAQRLQKRS